MRKPITTRNQFRRRAGRNDLRPSSETMSHFVEMMAGSWRVSLVPGFFLRIGPPSRRRWARRGSRHAVPRKALPGASRARAAAPASPGRKSSSRRGVDEVRLCRGRLRHSVHPRTISSTLSTAPRLSGCPTCHTGELPHPPRGAQVFFLFDQPSDYGRLRRGPARAGADVKLFPFPAPYPLRVTSPGCFACSRSNRR